MKGRVHPRVMKFVLSATLTRDPAKIAQLDLYCPLYLAPSAAENRYQLPKHLEAFKLVRGGPMTFSTMHVMHTRSPLKNTASCKRASTI